MMEHLEHSRRRLAADVQTVLSDMDELLNALRMDSAATTADVRARYDAALRRARIRIAQTKARTRARAGQVIGRADVYAHHHPWRTAGMAVATGAALGAVVGILGARH
jgi:ElaB/YqjD/DUF883 family membrane-anchored ribosome-binding protein